MNGLKTLAILLIGFLPAIALGQSCANGVCRLGSPLTATPVASSQPQPYGIDLAPGEVLVSVGGVSVQASAPARSGVVPALRSPVRSGAQAIAQSRANYMAKHNYQDHPPGNWASQSGGTFEGVGMTTRRNAPRDIIPTCTPRYRKQLVADAVAYGNRGSYRVRIWR